MPRKRKNLGNPALIAAAPAIIEQAPTIIKAVGEQQRETQKFIFQTAKPLLYVLGGVTVIVVGKAFINSQARKKAMQSAEATNAYAIYTVIKAKLPKKLIDIITAPIDMVTGLLQPIKAISNKVSELFDTEDKMYKELAKIKTNNINELTQCYKGLFQRDMQADLFDVIGVENAETLIKSWEATDKQANIRDKNVYVEPSTNKITVKKETENNKIEDYHSGWNKNLQKVYAITKRATKIYVVSITNGKLSLLPYNIANNIYIGITADFKILNATILGGTIFYNDKTKKNSLYIHLANKTLVAPVDDLFFFKTYKEFNAYCTKAKTKQAGL